MAQQREGHLDAVVASAPLTQQRPEQHEQDLSGCELLPPPEAGGALAEEGIDGLQVVFGVMADALDCGAGIEEIIQFDPLRQLHQAFGITKGLWRLSGDSSRKVMRSRRQCVRFHQFEQESDRESLIGLHDPAGEGQLCSR